MKNKQNQTWLFAFTDLAFLLLISLSLIPTAPEKITVRFSEMEIPEVPNNPNISDLNTVRHSWELQVHQKTDSQQGPFKLVKIGQDMGGAKARYSKVLDRETLITELETLRQTADRPVLLPKKDSLSRDFLFAAGALARVWPAANVQSVVKPIEPQETNVK